MQVYQFSLLVQAAGTVLLFLVFLLLFRKIRRRAFLDWIASWAFLLVGLGLLGLVPSLGESRRVLFFTLDFAFLAHAYFLLRGVRRFRDEQSASSPREWLWGLPALAIAWFSSALADPWSGRSALVALLLAGSYVSTAIFFALVSPSPAGRVLLSFSFLLWGVERAVFALAHIRFGALPAMPEVFQYANFLDMFLEMMIAVGIIILLFEASRTKLAGEMRQLLFSDQQLKEMGSRDPLTGLFNRHYFKDIIRRELAASRRYGRPLSVLALDIDRFKAINDVQGHAAGDEVLKFVANYLMACVRESDFVFRWGGDEFLILLVQTDASLAASKAEELLRNLPNIPGTGRVRPTLSVGWATHSPEAEVSSTLAEADGRMYEMKLKRKKELEEGERDLGRL